MRSLAVLKIARAGYYLCDNEVKIGRPATKAELTDLVAHYTHVKGVGVGHSWWGEQFCSGNDTDSINIVTTELNATLSLYVTFLLQSKTHLLVLLYLCNLVMQSGVPILNFWPLLLSNATLDRSISFLASAMIVQSGHSESAFYTIDWKVQKAAVDAAITSKWSYP